MTDEGKSVSEILEKAPAEKPYRSKTVLRELYHDHGYSTHEIADFLGCAQSTVRNWMDKHGIESRTISEAKWLKSPNSPNWVRLRVQEGGHVKWKISIDGVDRSISVHRLLAVAKYGIKEVEGKVVHHKNEIPWDNRPDNIELMELGDHSRHHSTKVEGLERIRVAELYRNGDIGIRPLGEMFGVSSTTVLNIRDEFSKGATDAE